MTLDSESNAGNPVIVDLPDFIPEEYELRLSIKGHLYVCRYGEATVDEVFRMIAEGPAIDGTQLMEKRRKIVTQFLKSHLAEGDAAQFEADMRLVPYSRSGIPFDIARLYESFLGRVVKKN